MLAYLYPNIDKFRIRRLNNDQIGIPFLAVKAFFLFKTLDEWRKVLQDWTEYALHRMSIVESRGDNSFFTEFEQFEKIIEVANLINMKESHYKGKTQLWGKLKESTKSVTTKKE